MIQQHVKCNYKDLFQYVSKRLFTLCKFDIGCVNTFYVIISFAPCDVPIKVINYIIN